MGALVLVVVKSAGFGGGNGRPKGTRLIAKNCSIRCCWNAAAANAAGGIMNGLLLGGKLEDRADFSAGGQTILLKIRNLSQWF